MEEVKDIVFLTLTTGWKNKKKPSGPTELDLEAGNLVLLLKYLMSSNSKYVKSCCQAS